MLELPLTIADVRVHECLYVNKSLSYKMTMSLQKMWTKPLNSYGLILQPLYELFEASKW